MSSAVVSDVVAGSPLQQSVASGLVVLGGFGLSALVYWLGERRASAARSGARVVELGADGGPGVPLNVRLGVMVGGLAPSRWWTERRAARERARLLPDFVEAVARSLSAGASLGRALSEAGEAVGDPFDVDMGRLTTRAALGVPLVEALDRWASDMGGEDARLFATACVLGAESGRGTADALTGVADTLADRRDVAAESRSLSSQARASAAMLVGLPLVFSIGVAFIDPATTRLLLTTPLGLGCLTGGLLLDGVGGLWMHRLVGAVT
jgi:tight adherence protein B